MKQIAVLAALFVALLAGVIVKESSRPSAGSLRDQVPLQRLGPAAFETADVARVEVAGPGGADAFALVREGDVWLVEGTFRAPASAGVVENLIEAVSASRGEIRLDDAAAFGKFDLTDERATTVVLRNAAGTAVAEFALGRSSGPQGAFVRPRFEGVRDGAYAVSQDLRGALGLGRTRPGDADPETPRAAHFHDVALPNLALEDTTRVEIESPGWTVAFEKAGAEWAAVEGAPDLPLKTSGVRNLVQSLGGALTATALVDPATRAEIGLDSPSYRVTAVLADGSRRTALGAADREEQRFYVRLDAEQDPEVVYECTRHAWERLFPPGSQLFEFKSLGVENKGLGEVRIDRAEDPFAMTRPGGDMSTEWEIVTPDWGLPPENGQTRNYVTLLNSVRPVDWYAGDAPFEEHAVIRYGPEGTPAEELTQLRVGQEDPAGVGRLAILADAPERVVVLSRSTLERLLPDLLSLFDDRPLAGAVPGDVTRIEVVPADPAEPGAPSYELVRGEEGYWTVRAGDTEQPGEANAIASWIDDLVRIEVVDRADGPVEAGVTVVIHRGDDVLRLGVGGEVDGEREITLDGAGFLSDTEIEVPAAASLVAEQQSGENPGAGEEDDAEDE